MLVRRWKSFAWIAAAGIGGFLATEPNTAEAQVQTEDHAASSRTTPVGLQSSPWSSRLQLQVPASFKTPGYGNDLEGLSWSLRQPALKSGDSGGFNAALLGLLLLGGGLVAGGAGFGILFGCPQGSACYSRPLEILGWVLAVPGIPPVIVGGVLLFSATGNSGRRSALPGTQLRLATGPAPQGQGATVNAIVTF